MMEKPGSFSVLGARCLLQAGKQCQTQQTDLDPAETTEQREVTVTKFLNSHDQAPQT